MKHSKYFKFINKFKFPKLSKEDKVFYGIVAVLGGCAVVFGGMILAPSLQMPKFEFSAKAPSTEVAPSEMVALSTTGGVIDPPAESSTKEELGAYFNKINAMAKDASEIVISKDCSVSPVYPRLAIGSMLTIKNTDSIGHEIELNPERNPRVGAGESITVKTDFSHGYGIYNFGCDKGAHPAGALILTPKK